ncbi:hypothetical protein J2125_000363 [Erwinia toletana]|uniref:DUF2525 domain-containing protein n=1 Tax=Winslowiella toletana TaxID=92490 RepID=A0ABS4P500_9GAMM|nr:YodD family peroxide/acid resistance protein [Winslowiella toletana]MBP2167171.1 hypothetical protein [Winslowiella toletana]
MTTAKEYSDNIQREVGIDVEALLEAIQRRASGEVQDFIESDDAHHFKVDGRAYHSCSELAEAFELDIRDFSISEVNR